MQRGFNLITPWQREGEVDPKHKTQTKRGEQADSRMRRDERKTKMRKKIDIKRFSVSITKEKESGVNTKVERVMS